MGVNIMGGMTKIHLSSKGCQILKWSMSAVEANVPPLKLVGGRAAVPGESFRMRTGRRIMDIPPQVLSASRVQL